MNLYKYLFENFIKSMYKIFMTKYGIYYVFDAVIKQIL